MPIELCYGCDKPIEDGQPLRWINAQTGVIEDHAPPYTVGGAWHKRCLEKEMAQMELDNLKHEQRVMENECQERPWAAKRIQQTWGANLQERLTEWGERHRAIRG